jgi:Carbohydrate-binding domain-containing protein Cthe_2159
MIVDTVGRFLNLVDWGARRFNRTQGSSGFKNRTSPNPETRQKMKKIAVWMLGLALVLALVACSGNTIEFTDSVPAVQAASVSSGGASTQQTLVTPISISVEYDSDDLDAGGSSSQGSTIRLEGDSIALEGDGATVNGSVVTITSAGTYNISGTLNDGQIVIETQDEETVYLVLNGMDITYGTSAPIYVSNAEKTVITLADGTENVVTDGTSYTFADVETDEPNAAIFSKDDLTINGNGSLTIHANHNNGIASKDDLKITGGTITVYAVNDGLKGRDSIAVKDGAITVIADGDGLQSSNDEDVDKGYIAIEGGTFTITAGLDAIQAETSLLVSGGQFTLTSGAGQTSAADSGKGIKAGVDLTITGGTFEIDSVDDALHANGSLTINDGVFLLASGDDGIHAEYSLTINGGEIDVLQAYEGFESAVITINGGNIHLVTSDDGLNATTGAGGEQVDGSYFYLNGGTVVLDASGDGLDSNGTAVVTGGVVIVQGPTFQDNGPLDVNGEFEISGGLLIAAGSAGMPETPSTSSTQNSIALVFDSTQPGGTMIHVESLDGKDVLTYESPKDYQLFVFSSPELETNTTYDVYVGGESTGTVTDGLYSDGTYTAGTQVVSLEISSSVTTLGTFEGNGGGVRGNRKP